MLNSGVHTDPSLTSARTMLKSLQSAFPAVPLIPVDATSIRSLTKPRDFFDELLCGIRRAKRRIVFASLYLGNEEQERLLVEAIREALIQKPDLRVLLLLDYFRGTRGQPNSVHVTQALLQDFPYRNQVALYHTPDMNQVLKKMMPARYNETIGLMHAKVYCFDDDVLLSGANLSSLYFDNRQDRYVLFSGQSNLAAYYHELLDVLAEFSYRASCSANASKYTLLPPSACDPSDEPTQFKSRLRDRLNQLFERWAILSTPVRENDERRLDDTWVVPLVQIGNIGITQEQLVLEWLLQHMSGDSAICPWEIHLTSGYFNFASGYKTRLLESKCRVHIISASPEANGFFNAEGLARHIPTVYAWIESQFRDEIHRSNSPIQLFSYRRQGWTYHAKGFWIYDCKSPRPFLVTIGSSNFGQRSVVRDVETQALILTDNVALQEELHENLQILYAGCGEVGEAKIPLWLPFLLPFVRGMF